MRSEVATGGAIDDHALPSRWRDTTAGRKVPPPALSLDATHGLNNGPLRSEATHRHMRCVLQGGAMACGNNHISRGYLSSPPISSASSTATFLNSPPTASKPSSQELADRGEALVASLLVEAQEHSLVTQHTPGDRPQGVDIVTLAPDGRLVVTEVKSTAAKGYRAPQTKQNVRDHQLDAQWTSRESLINGRLVAWRV